jgi:hypothetical protein
MKLKNFKETTGVLSDSKATYKVLMDLAEKAGYKWNSKDAPHYFDNDASYYKCGSIRFNPATKTMRCGYDQDDAIRLKKAVKFEVGDKVKIREDLADCDRHEEPGIVIDMSDRAGEIVTIREVYTYCGKKRFRVEGLCFSWLKKWLEPVIEEEKVFEEGKTYKFDLSLYNGTVSDSMKSVDWAKDCDGKIVTVRSATRATCGPKQYEIRPEWCVECECYNGKVVCIKEGDNFTKGKTYEVTVGRIIDDCGRTLPMVSKFTNFADLEAYFGDGTIERSDGYYDRSHPIKFIEVVE